MPVNSLHREVYPDGEGATYHELLNIDGKAARIHIVRGRRMRRAQIEVFADHAWRPVAHLAPSLPDPRFFAVTFQSPDSFRADRDELVRRFMLIYSAPNSGGAT